MKIKTLPLTRVKAGADDGLAEGEFLVYPSTFTRTPDAYGDVVAKGAFLDDIEAWKASGDILPGLWVHRMDDPDYFIASGLEQGEDDHGWWVKGVFDLENDKARQTYRLVKGRRVNQLSFAYDVLDEGRVTLDDGTKVNELRKLKVYEFSFVPIGANQDTSVVAIKAITDGIVGGLKAGRILSAKNETTLRDALDELDAARASIDSVLSSLGENEDGKSGSHEAAGTDGQEKAGGEPEVKSDASDEEPARAKSSAPDEEPKAGPSVINLAETELLLLTLGHGGESEAS